VLTHGLLGVVMCSFNMDFLGEMMNVGGSHCRDYNHEYYHECMSWAAAIVSLFLVYAITGAIIK
jgi:hypothetical protein